MPAARPGRSWCLIAPGAWLFPVPGHSRFLTVPGAWPFPVPGHVLEPPARPWHMGGPARRAGGGSIPSASIQALPAEHPGKAEAQSCAVSRFPWLGVNSCCLTGRCSATCLSVYLSVCPPQLAAFLGLHHVSEPLGYLCG